MRKIPAKASLLRRQIVEQKETLHQLENHEASKEKMNYERARLKLFETKLLLFIQESKKERKKQEKRNIFPLTILN